MYCMYCMYCMAATEYNFHSMHFPHYNCKFREVRAFEMIVQNQRDIVQIMKGLIIHDDGKIQDQVHRVAVVTCPCWGFYYEILCFSLQFLHSCSTILYVLPLTYGHCFSGIYQPKGSLKVYGVYTSKK